MLRIAIQSKGRLNEESLSLLQSIGIEVDAQAEAAFQVADLPHRSPLPPG